MFYNTADLHDKSWRRHPAYCNGGAELYQQYSRKHGNNQCRPVCCRPSPVFFGRDNLCGFEYLYQPGARKLYRLRAAPEYLYENGSVYHQQPAADRSNCKCDCKRIVLRPIDWKHRSSRDWRNRNDRICYLASFCVWNFGHFQQPSGRNLYDKCKRRDWMRNRIVEHYRNTAGSSAFGNRKRNAGNLPWK
ncbi:hypothetical protein D9M72_530630 [compost metagenome]